MKNFLMVAVAVFTLANCKSKEATAKTTLPKDISLKPDNALGQQEDHEKLSALIKEIEKQTSAETCTDAAAWRISPIGEKPCGGPSSYIAYPISLEDEILPKITNFTQMQSAFNKKYHLVSDCMMVQPPSGIKCEEGKAVLISGNSTSSEVQ